jgi:hypothetical protein
MFMRWIEDSLAGRTPQIDRIGISYMYFGAWQSTDGSSGQEFHVGPHLMIVSPHQDDFQGLNRDPSNGMPYVAHLPHPTELYLVVPARQWSEWQAGSRAHASGYIAEPRLRGGDEAGEIK